MDKKTNLAMLIWINRSMFQIFWHIQIRILKIKLSYVRNWKRYNGQENLLDFFAMNINYNYGQKKLFRK